VVGVLVEGRPATQVDGALMTIAVGPHVPARVHTVGGNADLIRHFHVGGGKAEQAAALITADDGASCLERPAEQARRDIDVAAGQRATDRRARDRLVDVVGTGDQLDRQHIKVGSEAELA
jgi:hypothetical protein